MRVSGGIERRALPVVLASILVGVLTATAGLPVLALVALGLTGALSALADERTQLRLLLAFLAVRPLLEVARSVDVGYGINAASLVSVAIVAWALCRSLVRRDLNVARWAIPWAALTLWGVVSSVMNGVTADALPDLLRLIQYLGVFYLATSACQTDSDRTAALGAACVGFAAVAVVMLPGLVQSFPAIASGSLRFQGVFAHPNALAFYALLSLVCWVAFSRLTGRLGVTVLSYLAMGVAALLIVSTGTRSVWVASAAAFLMLLPVMRGRLVAIVVSTGVAVSAMGSMITARMSGALSLDPQVSSLGFRVRMARAAIELFASRPLVGYGVGTFESRAAVYYLGLQAHNDYLRILVETGIPGLVLMVLQMGLIVLGTARDAVTGAGGHSEVVWSLGALAATVVFGVGSLSDNLITGGVFMTVVALLVGLWWAGHERSHPPGRRNPVALMPGAAAPRSMVEEGVVRAAWKP